MDRLGDVLEVMHFSHSKFASVRASGVAHGRTWRMWWAGAGRIRTEEDRPDGALTIVRSGDVWWLREPVGTLHTNEGDPGCQVGFGPGLELLHPRQLMSSAWLIVIGRDELAGRPAVLLRAEPRQHDPAWWAADEAFEVAVDLERGVVLRGPSFEVTSIEFDLGLPEGTFSAPPAGPRAKIVRPSERPREIGLTEARSVAAFPIRLPSLLPQGSRLEDCFLFPEDRPTWAQLSWTIDPGRRYRLYLRQGPGLEEQAPDGPVGPGGIVRTPRQALDMILVWARRPGGEWGEFESDLPADRLEAVARSWASDDE